MKKLFLFLTIFFSALSVMAQAPTKAEVIRVKYNEGRLDLSMPALLYRPSGYDPSGAKKYAVLFWCHGAGEGYSGYLGQSDALNNDGRALVKIFNNSNAGGPMYFIENTSSWPDSFRVGSDGVYEKLFIVTIQAPAWSLNPQQVDVAAKYLLQTYPFLDKDRMYAAGPSAGGETVINWIGRTLQNSSPFAQWNPMYNKLAAALPMSQANGYAQIRSQRAVEDSIRVWGFGSVSADQAGAQTQAQVNAMNAIKSGIARFTNYSGGHCCWNQFMNPTYTETIAGKDMNVYQWLLQYSRSVPTTPIITIPTNQVSQVITLPTSSVTVNGSYTIGSGSFVSKTWTRVSGPTSGFTIGSPNNEVSNFTFTSPGVYVFRLTVVSSTSTGTADVTITVNDPLPTVTSTNATQTLPTSSVALQSTATSNYTFTRGWTVMGKQGFRVLKGVIHGASTSTGQGLSDPSKGYAQRMAVFGSQYNLWTITNLSVGGQTVFDIDYVSDLASNPDFYVINMPSNEYPASRGYTYTQIMDRYRTIKAYCDARNIKLFITTTQPRNDYGTSDQTRLKIGRDSIVAAFGSIVIDVWTPLATSDNKIKPEYESSDPIHVNEAGQSRIFENVIAKAISSSFITGAGTIASPTSANTNITGLTEPGTYYYLHSMIDQRGYAAYSVSTVTVNAASAVPPAPTASSSPTSVTLPTNQVTATGVPNVASGKTVASHLWQGAPGGPTSFDIVSPNAAQTVIRFSAAGTYSFQYRATDNTGLSGMATLSITVNPNPSPSSAPYITTIGTTEYSIGLGYYYPAVDSYKVLIPAYVPASRKVEHYPVDLGGKNFLNNNTSIAGGFNVPFTSGNVLRIIDQDGYLWTTKRDTLYKAIRVNTDTTGVAFNNNVEIRTYASTWITRKSDGSLWYGGNDEYNLYPGTNALARPIRFGSLDVTYTSVSMGKNKIVALTSTGDYHEWSTGGSLTPLIRTPARPAIGVFASYNNMHFALIPDATGSQTMGYPYVWGTAFKYWGGTAAITTPTSLKTLWGLTAPIAEINGNQNTLAFVDSLGRLYTLGDNVQGELGIGDEFVNKMELNSLDYNWPPDYNKEPYTYFYSTPQLVAHPSGRKWKYIYNSPNLNYYWWAIDEDNKSFFWGRRKSFVGGDGRATNVESQYPNSNDQLTPLEVRPIENSPATSYVWTLPTLTAGSDTTTTASSITVSATGTPATGKSIAKWEWTWISNPGLATIANPTGSETAINNLTEGTYILNIQMTDNNKGTISARKTIIVSQVAPNKPPVAVAAVDKVEITPIIGQIIRSAAGSSDPDGFIKTYSWRRVSGPTQVQFNNALVSQTTVTGLTAVGDYVFELTVTDNDDAVHSIQVTVRVVAVVGGPPRVILIQSTGVNPFNRQKRAF